MGDRPKLTLVETLRASLNETETKPEHREESNVVDLAVERIGRTDVLAKDVTPEDLLKFILSDAPLMASAFKCYVTMISDDGAAFTVTNFRAGLDRSEEVAFRSLGLQEAMDNWRFGANGRD